MIRVWRGLLFVGFLAACSKPNTAASRDNVITQDMIEAASAITAWDVVARYRGDFIRNRGPTSITLGTQDIPVVFLNDVYYGPIESLRDIRAAEIAEIDFYSGTDAVIKFGSRYGSGVIQCKSRYK